MSENSDQQAAVEAGPALRHYCKVCKRGFGCAGALGGHMRSHATGDHHLNNTFHHHHHQQQQQHGHDHLISNNNNLRDMPGGNKHPYFLRNNTNRFTSYREIEDRGKFLIDDDDDKRVSSEVEDHHQHQQRSYYNIRQRSRNIKNYGDYDDDDDDDDDQQYNYNWQLHASREEEDLANCLVMLSNNKPFGFPSEVKEEKKAKQVEKGGIFQCKACKKVFNSHQALGGHRASHKKVKGCYAARFDTWRATNNNLIIDEEDFSSQLQQVGHSSAPPEAPRSDVVINQIISQSNTLVSSSSSSSRKAGKAHECSICHRVFSSGQALGGHKRCHWLTSNLPADNTNTFIPNHLHHQFHHRHYQNHHDQLFKKPMLHKPRSNFDLNFPPVSSSSVVINTNNNIAAAAPAPETDLSIQNPLSLKLWSNREDHSKDAQSSYHQQDNNNSNAIMHANSLHGGLSSAVAAADDDDDDQEQCKINLVKLSEHVNLDGGTSKWLQMGIAPTPDVIAAP